MDPATATHHDPHLRYSAAGVPHYLHGFASLPVSGSTNTAPANFRRGYIESWNLFVAADLGGGSWRTSAMWERTWCGSWQADTLNAAPFPSGSTLCMANGQFNPSSPYFTTRSEESLQLYRQRNYQPGALRRRYHPPAITPAASRMIAPTFSANYNGLQAQLSRNAGRLVAFGLVYTWSHAIDYEDNGAGSGSAGTGVVYPAYFHLNRATGSYDRTNNIQFWGIYTCPSDAARCLANGIASASWAASS